MMENGRRGVVRGECGTAGMGTEMDQQFPFYLASGGIEGCSMFGGLGILGIPLARSS